MKIRTDIEYLHESCSPVLPEELGSIKTKLLVAMRKYSSKGYAVAANQIGIQKRAFVMRKSQNNFMFFINPVLVKGTAEFDHSEGCLSLPGQGLFTVKRYKNITVKDDLHGEIELTGLVACIWQHEIDHLNGILICD